MIIRKRLKRKRKKFEDESNQAHFFKTAYYSGLSGRKTYTTATVNYHNDIPNSTINYNHELGFYHELNY